MGQRRLDDPFRFAGRFRFHRQKNHSDDQRGCIRNLMMRAGRRPTEKLLRNLSHEAGAVARGGIGIGSAPVFEFDQRLQGRLDDGLTGLAVAVCRKPNAARIVLKLRIVQRALVGIICLLLLAHCLLSPWNAYWLRNKTAITLVVDDGRWRLSIWFYQAITRRVRSWW
jgi:hypothetical protein